MVTAQIDSGLLTQLRERGERLAVVPPNGVVWIAMAAGLIPLGSFLFVTFSDDTSSSAFAFGLIMLMLGGWGLGVMIYRAGVRWYMLDDVIYQRRWGRWSSMALRDMTLVELGTMLTDPAASFWRMRVQCVSRQWQLPMRCDDASQLFDTMWHKCRGAMLIDHIRGRTCRRKPVLDAQRRDMLVRELRHAERSQLWRGIGCLAGVAAVACLVAYVLISCWPMTAALWVSISVMILVTLQSMMLPAIQHRRKRRVFRDERIKIANSPVHQ